MGSMMSSAMDENFKKNQAFMKECQQLQMLRQMQMQTQMQRRQMSMQLAGSREMFMWLASFYGVATLAMFAGYMKTKNPAVIAPFIPLSFIVGYQADYAHGDKIHRIRDEAERIMTEESNLLNLPHGLPSFQDIEDGRKAADSKAK